MLRQFLDRIRLRFFGIHRSSVDEELQDHLEREIEAKIAQGLSPAEARRQAAVAFGGLEKSREQCREQRPGYWLETSLQDLRYAFRGLRRNPVFTATVILTLMLGIGSTTAVISVVDRILFRPLPYGDGSRLVSVGLIAPIQPDEFALGGSYYEWQDHQTAFTSLTSESGVEDCDLTDARPERLQCASVEQNFLPTLGVSPILGRNFTLQEDRPKGPKVALISWNLWKTHYQFDPSVAGKIIQIDNHPIQIVGVLPRDFEMPRLQPADLVMPQAVDPADQRNADPGRILHAFARLKPGVSIEQAIAQMQPLFAYSMERVPPPFRKEVFLQVRSLRDRQIHFIRSISWILVGLVSAVLLIACANVAGLLIARGAGRERELAVRAALGASRLRLIRQSITESLLLGLAGAIAGIAFAWLLIRLLLRLAPQGMPYLDQAKIDGRILLFTLVTSLVSALLYGLIPALRRPRALALGSRTVPGSNSVAKSSLRQALVVTQIAACMVLLVASALLARSFANIERQNLGLKPRHVLTAVITLSHNTYPTPERQMAFFQELSRNLRYIPGVDSLTVSDSVPPGGNHQESLRAWLCPEGQPPLPTGTGGKVASRWITPNYFHALSIPILRGHAFTEEEQTSKEHFIILSSTLAKELFPDPSVDPIGKRMHLAVSGPRDQDPLYTIVGIAADVKNAGLTDIDQPEYYRLRRNTPEDWEHYATFLLETSLPPETLAAVVRAQLATLDPTVPVEIETLSAKVSELASQPRFQTVLVSFFALTGLALAMIGLYGVIAFAVTQRTQEIGVRMALGANRSNILSLVLKSGLRLMAWGTSIGILLALVASRMLSSILYKTSAYDLSAFFVVTVLMAAVAMLATLIPATSACAINPTEALRSE
jgi:predicted permease